MKRMLSLCAAALCLTLALTPTALAADFEPAVPNAKVCYPTAIVRGDDGTELKKIYDLILPVFPARTSVRTASTTP